MDNTRLPKHALNCKPRGSRDRGRTRKRWQSVDAETGQTTLSMEKGDDDDGKNKKTQYNELKRLKLCLTIKKKRLYSNNVSLELENTYQKLHLEFCCLWIRTGDLRKK